MIKSLLPEQTLRRIPLYHQILSELEQKGEEYVSSAYLANFFRIEDTQVRKDVSLINHRGKPKSGYSVIGLKKAIGDFLGINYENSAILIGAGKLGSALIEYPGLAEYGLKIVGIFDNNPTKIGKAMGSSSILPLESIDRVVNTFNIGIAILTVPKIAAQETCDLAVSQGIKGIWNFAPVRLQAPPDVIVKTENLAVGLAILSHYLKRR